MILGSHMTSEQKEHVSMAHRGHIMPEATRTAIHNANLGSHRSPESCAKISVAKMGHTVSDSTRLAVRQAQTGHYMSPETRAKIGAAESGFLNSSWKGGITPENMRIRGSLEYAIWRTAVFERDNHTCQECGQYGGELNAHHVHGFAAYPGERFVVDNGKTLCLECHNKTKGRGAEVFAMEG